MPIATLTSKGQITIPVAVRKDLGLQSGSRVQFLQRENGSYELIPVTGSIADLKGIIPWSGPAVALEQMDEAIAAAAAEITSS